MEMLKKFFCNDFRDGFVAFLVILFFFCMLVLGVFLLYAGKFSGANFVSYFGVISLVALILPFFTRIVELSFYGVSVKLAEKKKEIDDVLKKADDSLFLLAKILLASVFDTDKSAALSGPPIGPELDKFRLVWDVVEKNNFQRDMRSELLCALDKLLKFRCSQAVGKLAKGGGSYFETARKCENINDKIDVAISFFVENRKELLMNGGDSIYADFEYLKGVYHKVAAIN